MLRVVPGMFDLTPQTDGHTLCFSLYIDPEIVSAVLQLHHCQLQTQPAVVWIFEQIC